MFGRRKEKKTTPTAQTPAVDEDPLTALCQGDEKLHSAMSYFLYLRPEEQVARLGTTEQLIQKATEAIGRGELVKARADYTDAAWIELYSGNKANLKLFLEKALSLQDGDGPGRLSTLRLRTLLLNLGKVMTIAMHYYHDDDVPNPTASSGDTGGVPVTLSSTE